LVNPYREGTVHDARSKAGSLALLTLAWASALGGCASAQESGDAERASAGVEPWDLMVRSKKLQDLDSLRARVVVPPLPTAYADSVVIFLNLGVSAGATVNSHTWTKLIQTVLQVGFNGRAGGRQWLISCWFSELTGRGSQQLPIVGNWVGVQPGDTVNIRIARMSLRMGPGTADVWECEAQPGSGEPARLDIIGDPMLDLLYVHAGLETQPLHEWAACDNYPSSSHTDYLRVTAIADTVATPLDWDPPQINDRRCGKDVTFPDSSTVRIHY
jgi:hypothetical protein